MERENELEQCREKAAQVFQKAMNFVEDLSNWQEVGATPSVSVYKRPTKYGFNACKVEGFIDKPCGAVAEYTFTRWPELESQFGNMAKLEFIKTYSDGSKLRYEKSPAFGPVMARDCYVYSSLQSLGEDTWAILDFTAPIAVPQNPDCVRGDLKFRLQTFTPVAGNTLKTHLTVSEIIDPKGHIPSMLISQISMEKAELWKKIVEELQTL